MSIWQTASIVAVLLKWLATTFANSNDESHKAAPLESGGGPGPLIHPLYPPLPVTKKNWKKISNWMRLMWPTWECLHGMIACNTIAERLCNHTLGSFSFRLKLSRRFLSVNVWMVNMCPSCRGGTLTSTSCSPVMSEQRNDITSRASSTPPPRTHHHPTQPWPSICCTAPAKMNMLSLAFSDVFSLYKMAL